MTLFKQGYSPPVLALLALMVSFGLAGCEGDDGAAGPQGVAGVDGTDGMDGTDGTDGADGISCWDLNENGEKDLPDEDINGDGVVDIEDCSAAALADAYKPPALHRGYFAERPYQGTESCMGCHGGIGDEIINTGHFKWEGVASNIEGFEGGDHGKKDIINNFCIAIASNEGRCTQCHIGYGYADDTFDFGDRNNVDCLVCHDQTGTYAKAKGTAGRPVGTVDLQAVAQSVGEGSPTIDNCIFCHANAGGGDNVKHGDLSMSLANTTFEYDVHMGTADSGGQDFECIRCHEVKRDADEKLLSHGIGGMPYHSVEEGEMKQCGDCHGDRANIHAGYPVQFTVEIHPTLACQVCHIPTFARNTSTKTAWYWEDAGPTNEPDVITEEFGRPNWDVMKGTFVWEKNVRPTLRYFNGKYRKALLKVNDKYTSLDEPAVLAEPVGDHTDPEAMIYPFKKMIGNQPADADPANRTILVPHLFGTAGGPTPFWPNYNWDLALEEGALAAGQTYSGDFLFVDTVMYLSVNHEVAPKEEAYGMGGGDGCTDCHFGAPIDWTELGWTNDPLDGGTRPD